MREASVIWSVGFLVAFTTGKIGTKTELAVLLAVGLVLFRLATWPLPARKPHSTPAMKDGEEKKNERGPHGDA